MPQTEKPKASYVAIASRPASANDSKFLLQVYASTRQEEIAAWGWTPAQQESFTTMQFGIRQRGYAAAYPGAETSVILVSDIAAGAMIVSRERNEIRLVDIALLSEFRGRGIGEELMRSLISEAGRSNSSLRLSVVRGNRALRLYERLGFVATGGDTIYCEMEYKPAPG